MSGIIKWVVIVVIVLGLSHWYVQQHSHAQIAAADAGAQGKPAADTAAASSPAAPSATPDNGGQVPAEPVKITVPTGTPLAASQPLTEDEQRRALAGNQQCINGAVVEYTSATHTFAKLGPPDVHCTDRMADTPLR